MAIIPETEFPGKIDGATEQYPLGKARNVTTAGDGTGTPFVEDLVNDVFGMQQGLLGQAGITATGNPDDAVGSQYVDSMRVLARPVRSNIKENIYHRGAQNGAPENTLLAASMVINRSIGQNMAMECDVQISLDGIPVVFHDLNVDQLTNGTGNVKDLTFAQLKALKFTRTIGTAFEEYVHIPSYDEFIRFLSKRGVKVYPEIKGYRTNADIALIDAVTVKYHYEQQTVYTSFIISDLEDVRTINKQSGVGWSRDSALPTVGELDQIQALGNVTMIWPFTGTFGFISNPTLVDTFFARGFDIATFTIDRNEHIQDVSDLGIQKIITDANLLASADLTTLATQRRFNQRPWSEVTTAGGTVTFLANPENSQPSGDLVECESGASADARVRFPFTMTAGEVTQMTVLAANIGTHADEAQIDIDYPFGTRRDTLNIISTEMIEYQITLQADFNENFAAWEAAFVLGSSFTRDSGAVFYRPQIKSSNSAYGHERVIMAGYLRIAVGDSAGAYDMDPDTTPINVDSITTVGSDIDIRPQSEANLNEPTLGSYFGRCQITASIDGQVANPLLFFAECKSAQGIITLSALDASTLAQVNLSTVAIEHRIYFEVKI